MPVALLIRIAPYALCLLVGLGTAWKLTSDHYQAIITKMNLDTVKQLAVAQEQVIKAEKTQQDITQKVTTAYELKRKEIEANYSSLMFNPNLGLRIDTQPNTGGLRTVPKSASQPNGPANCNRLSTELRKAAELNTLQLIYLQDWVAEQEKAAQ